MERSGLDWTLAFGGIIGALMVIGTVILAFAGRDIPSVLTTGVLSVIGFFFTKGVVQTVTRLPSSQSPPPPPPTAPPEGTAPQEVKP